MSTSFSRSIRSIESDSYRVSLTSLSLAMLLLLVWLLWFFLARVTIYEMSTTATFTNEETVVASYPPESYGRIKQGQKALLYIDDMIGTASGTIPAVVTEVHARSSKERIHVTIYPLFQEPMPTQPLNDTDVTVRIESEYVAPAVLVMRTVGIFVETPQILTSPQK